MQGASEIHRRRLAIALGAVILLAFSQGSVIAHDLRPPWLEESAYEHGIYAVVKAPHVVRQVADVELTTEIRNMAGGSDVTVEEITYSFPQHSMTQQSLPGRLLPTQRERLSSYQALRALLNERADQKDRQAVGQLTGQCHALLEQMATQAYIEKRPVGVGLLSLPAGSAFTAVVEIHLAADGLRWTLRREVTIPIRPPLPRGAEDAAHWRYDLRTGLLEGEPEQGAGSPKGNGTLAIGTVPMYIGTALIRSGSLIPMYIGTALIRSGSLIPMYIGTALIRSSSLTFAALIRSSSLIPMYIGTVLIRSNS